MHESRLASPIVADKSDAFSAINREIHSGESPHGREMLLDPDQPDDVHGGFGHHSQRLNPDSSPILNSGNP
jgi:hypothetical protein